jgi:hypothetical protein
MQPHCKNLKEDLHNLNLPFVSFKISDQLL